MTCNTICVVLLWATGLALLPAAPEQKLPPPDESALQRAEREVRDIFHPSAANTPSAKMELAKKLAEVADETTDDPAALFVVLRLSARLAGEAGQLAPALQVVGRLENRFDVDGLALRSECVQTALASVRSSAAVKQVAQAAIPVVEEALAADRFEVAAAMVKALHGRVRAARDRALIDQVADLRKRGADLFRLYQQAKGAFDTLKPCRRTRRRT